MKKKLLIWGTISTAHKDCFFQKLLKREILITRDEVIHKEVASPKEIAELRKKEGILNILIAENITESMKNDLESEIEHRLEDSEEVVLVSFHANGIKPINKHVFVVACTTLDMCTASFKFPGKKLSKVHRNEVVLNED
jgi:hypothetical protein